MQRSATQPSLGDGGGGPPPQHPDAPPCPTPTISTSSGTQCTSNQPVPTSYSTSSGTQCTSCTTSNLEKEYGALPPPDSNGVPRSSRGDHHSSNAALLDEVAQSRKLVRHRIQTVSNEAFAYKMRLQVKRGLCAGVGAAWSALKRISSQSWVQWRVALEHFAGIYGVGRVVLSSTTTRIWWWSTGRGIEEGNFKGINRFCPFRRRRGRFLMLWIMLWRSSSCSSSCCAAVH